MTKKEYLISESKDEDDAERPVPKDPGTVYGSGGYTSYNGDSGAAEGNTHKVSRQDGPQAESNDTTSGAKGDAPGNTKDDPEKPPKRFKNNRYATKKTAGQGLMGVSLITSNTTQLKNTLDEGAEADYFVLIITLLIMSLALQLIVGVLLMIIGARESKLDGEATKGTKKTEKLNDISTFFIFLITMVNATLATFTVELSNPETTSSPLTAGGMTTFSSGGINWAVNSTTLYGTG